MYPDFDGEAVNVMVKREEAVIKGSCINDTA